MIGSIGASHHKKYLFPILLLKRVCDVYDEEFEEAMELYGDEKIAKAPKQHRIEVPEGCHWNDIFAVRKGVGKALKAAFLGIEKTDPRLYGVFGDAQWTDQEGLSDLLLVSLVEHFNKIPLGISAITQDDLRATYECFIKKFTEDFDDRTTTTKLYTDTRAFALIARAMEFKPGEDEFDSVCGPGGMFINAVDGFLS